MRSASPKRSAPLLRDCSSELPGNKRSGLTLSIGVSSCCTPEDNLDSLVSLADAALYKSKEAGRNKISSAKR